MVLHDEKHLLETMSVEEGKMNHELKRRHALLHNFHESYLRYRQQIIDANLRMDDIKKKLSEMQVCRKKFLAIKLFMNIAPTQKYL